MTGTDGDTANRPNVLFVCVDALRSDFALGEYGADKPFFEFFEREGMVFDTMVSAASSTTPCVASYMTGQYPPDHGILSLWDFALDDDVTTLAEVFHAAGYETTADVCGPITSDTRLDAGFDAYNYRERDVTVYTDWYDEFTERLTDSSDPWFSYLHLWEVHVPRTEPPDADPDERQYDASIRGVAEKLTELLEAVDLEETVVAVTGDHGESIYDGTIRNRAAVIGLNQVPVPFTDLRTRHVRSGVYERYLRPNGIEPEEYYNALRRFSGVEFPNALHRTGHGYHVYDFLTRVPFVIAGPGVPEGEHVDSQVRQVDIFPTLLSAADLDPPAVVTGQDLLGDTIDHRPAYARAVGAFDSEDRWLDGVRYDGWKFVKGRERSLRQLFDLDSDPHELHNVIDEYPGKAAELESLVDDFVARERDGGDHAIPEEAEERMTSRLHDLGYL